MEQPRKRHKKHKNAKQQSTNDAKREAPPKASKSKLERISPPRDDYIPPSRSSCSCFRVCAYVLLLSLTAGGAFCTWYMWDDGIGQFVNQRWTDVRLWYKEKFMSEPEIVKSENEFEETYNFHRNENFQAESDDELFHERLKSSDHEGEEDRNELNIEDVNENDYHGENAEYESKEHLEIDKEHYSENEQEQRDEQDENEHQRRDVEDNYEENIPENENYEKFIAKDQIDTEAERNEGLSNEEESERESVRTRILQEIQKESYKVDGRLGNEKMNEVPNFEQSFKEIVDVHGKDEERETMTEGNLSENEISHEYSIEETFEHPGKLSAEEQLEEKSNKDDIDPLSQQEPPFSSDSPIFDPKDDVAAFASSEHHKEIPLDIVKVQKYEEVKKAKEQKAGSPDEGNQTKVIKDSEIKDDFTSEQSSQNKNSEHLEIKGKQSSQNKNSESLELKDENRGLKTNVNDDISTPENIALEKIASTTKSKVEESGKKDNLNDITYNENTAKESLPTNKEDPKTIDKSKEFTIKDNSIKQEDSIVESVETKPTDDLKNEVRKIQDDKLQRMKAYSHHSITNELDYEIRNYLDSAAELLKMEKFNEALQSFTAILFKYPQSPRASYGKALALNGLAEQQKSNQFLEQCINELDKTLDLFDIPDDLFKKTAELLIERSHFRGFLNRALNYQKRLISKFPQETAFQNQMAVTYLLLGREDEAKAVLQKVLSLDPDNGFAKVHLGFILKTHDRDIENGVRLMQEGLRTNAEGTDSGRFFYHLGDGLQRLNKTKEAYKVYEEGVKRGHFLSAYQRSLYNVNSLTGRPWWTAEQTTYQKFLKLLEDNWQTIRDEGFSQMDPSTGMFSPESEDLSRLGEWKQYTLYSQGRKWSNACQKTPKTCALIDQIPDAAGCKRGQVKFSVMQPGTYVWPHTGPTNCRLRSHLGLIVPPGSHIRVANETRTWAEGKFIIFDDSFEHEVWHDGSKFRLIFIVDFWHPELTDYEKRTLSPI